MTSKSVKTVAGKKSNPDDQLAVVRQPEETEAEALARVAYDPIVRALGVGRRFVTPVMGEHNVMASLAAIERQAESVKNGDLSDVERKLVAQADTLDAIFCDMARRSAQNAGQYLEAMEVYMRLALTAQRQCRATLETLANIKNPPVVIAKQANIAAGPQQVNNGAMRPDRDRARKKNEIDNQPHATEAAGPDAPSSSAPLLGHEQEVTAPMQGTCSQRLESVPDARGQIRRAKR